MEMRILKQKVTANFQWNLVKLYRMLSWILVTWFHFSSAHHWIPAPHQVVHGTHIGHPAEIVQQPLKQKLRFKIVYDASANILSFSKQVLVKQKLMPAAISYFHHTYFVRQTKRPIILQRMCKDNSFFLKNEKGDNEGDLQFCKEKCVNTVCGPVTVSDTFLDDCRTCNEHGHDCEVHKNTLLSPDAHKIADFILFVSALATDHCKEANIVAYASYCQQEHTLNRPVAGFANLCPSKLETDPQSFESLLSTVKHEIYHALGFSVGLFAFYRDKDGHPLTPRLKHGLPRYNNASNLYQWSDKIVRKFVRKDWSISGGKTEHEVRIMVTPTVVREARRHFNCPDLEGAELENQGGEGTALTHWEKRVFENEAMTGTYTQHPVFSRITLALMEDTGWYKANYDMAEELDWGKNLGCLFVKNNCRAWIADRITNRLPTAPFCATLKQSPLHMRCTHTKLSLALCNLVKYSAKLPQEFRYFDRLGKAPVKDIYNYGGAVELADFCPFYQKFTLTEESGRRRGTTCTLEENSPLPESNYALENYTAHAKCVEHGRHWTARKGLVTRTMLDWGSGCYNYECSRKGLVLYVDGTKYTCNHRGKMLEINGTMKGWEINGSLVCPACSDFCGEKGYCPNFLSKLMVKLTALDEKPANYQHRRRSNALTLLCNLWYVVLLLTLVLLLQE